METVVPSTKFQNAVGKYLGQAQDEPVIIEKSGRPTAVLLSFEEYEQLKQLRQGLSADQQRLLRLGTESLALLKRFSDLAAPDLPDRAA